MLNRFFVFCAVAFASSAASAQSVPRLSNAGSLICTTSETAKSAAIADATLLCRFHALTGRDAKYRGWIGRKGQADLPPGKRVLAWAVLAHEANISPVALAGTYEALTGGRHEAQGQLRGGKKGRILLEPLSRASQIGDRVVPSVLELRLERTSV
jgi:hypothetical protein